MKEEILAKVHSFDTFGAADGPGIRFIIFLQGCHLSCKYCQNRDTWDCSIGTNYSVSEILEKILRYKNYVFVISSKFKSMKDLDYAFYQFLLQFNIFVCFN